MTREEIIVKWDTLTPRERDAWVADVVFAIPVQFEYSPSGPVYLDERTLLNGRYHICNYTANIAAAFTVAERYWSYALRMSDGQVSYGFAIYDSDGERVAYANADTAPKAICLAALIAEYERKQTEVSE